MPRAKTPIIGRMDGPWMRIFERPQPSFHEWTTTLLRRIPSFHAVLQILSLGQKDEGQATIVDSVPLSILFIANPGSLDFSVPVAFVYLATSEYISAAHFLSTHLSTGQKISTVPPIKIRQK